MGNQRRKSNYERSLIKKVRSRFKNILEFYRKKLFRYIEFVFASELILPENMQRSLAAEAEEKQGAKARVREL